jgi:hypothetical protein
MWREPSTRVAAGAILAVLCSFLWIDASYYYWDGGWSTGPRHLVPMLALCCLALAFAWPRAFWARTVALVLLTASLVLSLICAVAGMFAPRNISNPLVDFLLPIFLTPAKLLKSLPIGGRKLFPRIRKEWRKPQTLSKIGSDCSLLLNPGNVHLTNPRAETRRDGTSPY